MELRQETSENILQEYTDGVIKMTRFSNFVFGVYGRIDIESIIYKLLKDTPFEIKKKKSGFILWTCILHNSVDRTFLESKFKAIYHKNFGEGLKDCNPKVKNASCISFFARTDKDKLVHFYIDERGTDMDVQTDFTPDEAIELIRWYATNKIEVCPDEIKPYVEMVNKK